MNIYCQYSHQCTKCRIFYIPYDDYVPCPNCGIIENKRYDFISVAFNALNYNSETYGSYIPENWSARSQGDYVLDILFHLFDAFYEAIDDNQSFIEFASDFLYSRNYEGEEYLIYHILGIAIKVDEKISNKREEEYLKACGYDYDPYSEVAIYKVGDIVEVNLREAKYWRIEYYDNEYYTVSVVDYDGYLKEYIFSGTVLYVKANHKYLHQGKCVDNVLVTEKDKTRIKDREISSAHFLEEYLDEDEDEADDVYIDKNSVKKKQEIEDYMYDYSDFDADNLDNDDIPQ